MRTVLLVISASVCICFLGGCSNNTSEPVVPISEFDSSASLDKYNPLMPDPWPFEFQKHEGISDFDAKRAQMIAGLAMLTTCSNVLVTIPDNGFSEVDAVVIFALRPDEKWGVWYIDLEAESRLGEIVIVSTDVGSLSFQDADTEVIYTEDMIDDAAILESSRDQVMFAAAALGIDTEGLILSGIWNRIKNAWNEMNLCEQVHLVGGLAACTMAGAVGGPGVGLMCGAGVWVSSTGC